MQPVQPETVAAFDRLARESGTFGMLAIDQRESLRTMFHAVMDGSPVPDALLAAFKVAAAEQLGGEVSGILLDRLQGAAALARLHDVHPDRGVILAADTLMQEPGGPVTDTQLDPEVDAARAREERAAALKLLVLWTGEQANREHCVTLARELVRRSREAGVVGIVEGIVRAPAGGEAGWDREAAIVEAARELGATGVDLYKAEVPLFGRGEAGRVEDACAAITDALDCPWVVLSSGVEPPDFPAAVESACRAGASGFLAGRAIWRDAVHPVDYVARLRELAVPRARELMEIVDACGRPWRAALASA